MYALLYVFRISFLGPDRTPKVITYFIIIIFAINFNKKYKFDVPDFMLLIIRKFLHLQKNSNIWKSQTENGSNRVTSGKRSSEVDSKGKLETGSVFAPVGKRLF
jgi:hypothetical protein